MRFLGALILVVIAGTILWGYDFYYAIADGLKAVGKLLKIINYKGVL